MNGHNLLDPVNNSFTPSGHESTVKYHVCQQKVFSAQQALAQFTPLGHEGNDGDIPASPAKGRFNQALAQFTPHGSEPLSL